MAHDWEKMKKSNSDQVVDNVDAMNEIFKHLDAHSLAVASCVSRRWYVAAMDDNLWEVICTRHWPASGICIGRLKCVVNVMGGFRRLYVKWLHPLCTHSAASNSNTNSKDLDNNVVWTADQVHLSLSLLSVEYFEKLGPFATASCHGNSCTISRPQLLHKEQEKAEDGHYGKTFYKEDQRHPNWMAHFS
ncbi:hypothetical protein SUGI_0660440 [Cryptomeria japonica]|uniref:F-box protein GID2 n=1 Tax=Cryptomeria japonica TaxID=3369 RepID=UPI00241471B2|nr:F-box protein GID2 [Cryptomeria japonica]GLJ32800.1 hypothetical protein SUGI_0660440 [Cryptomeria japonica]